MQTTLIHTATATATTAAAQLPPTPLYQHQFDSKPATATKPATSGQNSRRRPPRSCTHCARRKLSCDKIRPACGRCAKGGLRCQYAFGNAASVGSIAIIDETSAVIAENFTVNPSKGQVQQTPIKQQPDTPAAATPYNDSKRDSVILTHREKHEYPGHLYRGQQAKSRFLSASSFMLAGGEPSSADSMLRTQQGYQVTRPGAGSFQSSRVSSRAPSSNDGSESNQNAHFYGDIFLRTPLSSFLNSSPGILMSNSTESIVAELPSRAQCDVLVSAYMIGFHTMKPIVDIPALLKELDRFHAWKSGQQRDFVLGSHFLALLVAVLFAGSVVCPRARLQQVFGYQAREDISGHLYQLAISAVRHCAFPQNPSLHTLSAFLIVNAIWLRDEQPLTCCAFVGVALRVAQMLGLHKEPSKFKNIDDTEVQIRRNMWWTLVSIDTQVALAAALPPLITCKLYDVKPVVAAAPDHLTSPLGQQLDTSVLSLFIAAKYRYYASASEFLHEIHKDTLEESDLDSILALAHDIRKQMESYKDQIITKQREVEEHVLMNHTANGGAIYKEPIPFLAELSKNVLSMFAAKPFAFMYGSLRKHNLLGHLLAREPHAMMNCRESLHRFLQLTQRSDFQPWHWVWPGRHQPLHSIMALINDLDENPTTAFAIETRQLVDLALSLCSNGADSSGIISSEDGEPDPRPLNDGGFAAWKFIRAARDDCWERAGLDPTVLYCPEHVSQIRFGSVSFIDEYMVLPAGLRDGEWAAGTPHQPNEWSFLNQMTTAMDWDLNNWFHQ